MKITSEVTRTAVEYGCIFISFLFFSCDCAHRLHMCDNKYYYSILYLINFNNEHNLFMVMRRFLLDHLYIHKISFRSGILSERKNLLKVLLNVLYKRILRKSFAIPSQNVYRSRLDYGPVIGPRSR